MGRIIVKFEELTTKAINFSMKGCYMRYSAKKIMNKLATKSCLLRSIGGEEKKRLQQTLVGMMNDIHAVCQKHEISRTNVQNTMERTYLTTVLLMVFLQEHSLKNRVLKMNN